MLDVISLEKSVLKRVKIGLSSGQLFIGRADQRPGSP